MSTVPAVLPNPRTSAPAQYLRPEGFGPEGAGRARAPWLIAPGPSLAFRDSITSRLRHSSFGSDAAAARFATILIETRHRQSFRLVRMRPGTGKVPAPHSGPAR